MSGNRSFIYYITDRFYNEFYSHLKNHIEENQDSLDLNIQNVHDVAVTQGDGSIVLFSLLSGIKEDGTVPIYVVPGLIRTKVIYMSDMVSKLTVKFNKEKNIGKKEVIEYLQEYRLKKEIETLFKNN